MRKQKSQKISFTRDIIDRKVPQIVGLYMAVSWGLIQFVIWLVNEFVLSPLLPQFTFILLLSLLPTAVLLAYFHGKPGKDIWNRIEKIGIPLNILATILILIVTFSGKELGAAEQKVTIQDEAGNKIERTIIKNQFRKRIAIFAFENMINDSSMDWLKYGIPSLLAYDMTQDMYIDARTIYNFVEKIKRAEFSPEEKLPLTLQLKIARDSHLNYLLSGTYLTQDNKIEVNTKLYEVDNGKQIAENSFTDQNIFDIIDNISVQLKQDFDLPQKYLENIKDLPVSEIMTASIPAMKEYIQGRNAYTFYNNYDRAIRFIKNAVNEDPLFSMSYLRLAILYLNSANVDDYRKAMQSAMKKIYKLPEVYQFETKAIYYQLDEQPEKVLAILKMWADLYPEDIVPHQKLLNFYANISNEINLAIAEGERILEIDPSQYNFVQVLGNLYKQKANYDQALKYFKQYAEYFPKNTESFTAIGKVYETIGQFDQAISFYEKALLIEPGNSATIINLADIQKKTGHFLNAEKQYNDALMNSQTPQQRSAVYAALENLFLIQGQVNKAINFSELKAKQMKKYINPLNYILGEMNGLEKYIDVGKEHIAFDVLKSIKLEPPLDKFIPVFYLILYTELEDVENIEKELNKVEELISAFGFSEVQNYVNYVKGRLNQLKKNYKTAIELYQNYLKYVPADDDAMVRIGVCYKELKENDEAIQFINNALTIMPVNAKAIYELALVYLKSGDKPNAMEYLNNALEIWKNADPEFIPAQKSRNKLAELTNAS